MKGFINYWFPVIIWMGVIFTFSSRQRVSVSDTYAINFLFFKTLHVCEYMFLMILAYRAVRETWKSKTYIAFMISIVFAASDELHQLFVATREGTVRDVIIDSVGVLLAWIILVHVLPKMPKRLKVLARNLRLIS